MRVSRLLSSKFFPHKVYGEYRFTLSPHQQSVWKNFTEHAFVRVFHGWVARNWYFWGPSATVYILAFNYAKTEHARRSRKDPKEYENDV